jgi:hypothetical protein
MSWSVKETRRPDKAGWCIMTVFDGDAEGHRARWIFRRIWPLMYTGEKRDGIALIETQNEARALAKQISEAIKEELHGC